MSGLLRGFGMAGSRVSREEKSRALSHVIGSIDDVKSFPEQVFRGRWSAFMFFESDRLFASSFAAVAADLLSIESAEVCCLLNFSEMDRRTDEFGAVLFLDAETGPHSYDAMLRRGGPANGWLFGTDRYGSASNLGGWSIYCEKGNDIAVIAFRQLNDKEKYAKCLEQLHAESITTLVSSGSTAIFPFGQLTEPWRNGLSQHYSCEY